MIIKRRILIPIICFIGFLSQAQHTISGTFSPAKDYSWVIAYALTPGSERYVADTAIKQGKFILNIPQNAPSGTYRLVYAVPQDEFFFDVLYNGKEDIKLGFNTDRGLQFLGSKENLLYRTYFNESNGIQREIINYYVSRKTDKTAYTGLIKKLRSNQKSYEDKTVGLICHNFIKASSPYIPTNYEAPADYVQHISDNYFTAIDFKNLQLQSSSFLTDRVNNYAFTSIPQNISSQKEIEKIIIENTKVISSKLLGVTNTYKLYVFNTLWEQAKNKAYNDVSDFVYQSYIKPFAQGPENKKLITEIESHNRLRIGAKAPEIIWKEGSLLKKLSSLESAKNYLLVFWSSTCSHCLKELPALHKELEGNPNIKVIAIGLEDNETTWKLESAKLSNFNHAIALGKWESEYAKLYAIQQTPTYFILDSQKQFVSKPKSDKEVVDFFKKNK